MKSLAKRLEALLAANTVTWRMRALLRVLAVSLIGLFFIFVVDFTVNYQATNSERRLETFSRAVQETRILTLTARRHEKDFYLRKDPQYIANHKETVAQLKAKLNELIQLSPDEQLNTIVSDIKKSIDIYGGTFAKTAELMTTVGLNQESGLHGKFRDAARDAETKISADSYEIRTAYLEMRRNEKDFIQRESEEFSQAYSKQLEKSLSLIERVKLSEETKQLILTDFKIYGQTFNDFVTATLATKKSAEVARQAARQTEPLVDKMLIAADEAIAAGLHRVSIARTLTTVVITIVVLLTASLLYLIVTFISRSVTNPVNHLQETIARLQNGDDTARSHMIEQDELSELGRTLDGMIDARLATQRRIQDENDSLNDSVLNLLQAVALLARRDLTIKVPVTEDVTGPVADALNLLTTETAKVLRQVSDLSADVASASLRVQEQSNAVIQVAVTEQKEVAATAISLGNAAEAMGRMSKLARGANQSAELAIRATQQAMDTVSSTVSGINMTRDMMRETEKQIKRLGERSQDISQAVNLINSIAERTHVLALNASMHAASAGEAGRGFAVVADEVQRLAESSRQATQQIAALVKNIQADTAETVGTMNLAIEQVVSGSRLAEQAGTQMQETQRTTAELVRSVHEIAESTEDQLKNNQELLVRADAIRVSTEETSRQLGEQAGQANNLVEYARSLVAAVRVFKLAD